MQEIRNLATYRAQALQNYLFDGGAPPQVQIHPSQVPISRTFEVKDYPEVWGVIEKMLDAAFSDETGFKILMPREKNLARRMGYTIVNELNKNLRIEGYRQKILYFVYHHDASHYAIVLVSEEALSRLES